MKLSENTISVLKNFAGINVNLVIEPGNVIRTLGMSRNIFARAEVEDNFTSEIRIYDLNSFLQSISLFPDTELEFEDKYVNIQSGDATIKYNYADPSVVSAAPNKEIVLNEELFKCEMSAEDVNALMKVAAALAAPTIAISNTKDAAKVVVCDRKNTSSHMYSKKLTPKSKAKVSPDFDAVLRVENFKLLPGKYVCTIGKKINAKDQSVVGVVKWENQDIPLTYWMTVETDSKL